MVDPVEGEKRVWIAEKERGDERERREEEGKGGLREGFTASVN